jgi:hypothetical protein
MNSRGFNAGRKGHPGWQSIDKSVLLGKTPPAAPYPSVSRELEALPEEHVVTAVAKNIAAVTAWEVARKKEDDYYARCVVQQEEKNRQQAIAVQRYREDYPIPESLTWWTWDGESLHPMVCYDDERIRHPERFDEWCGLAEKFVRSLPVLKETGAHDKWGRKEQRRYIYLVSRQRGSQLVLPLITYYRGRWELLKEKIGDGDLYSYSPSYRGYPQFNTLREAVDQHVAFMPPSSRETFWDEFSP